MHISVMLNEVLECLMPSPGKVIVDCTIGSGGHSLAILSKLLPGGRLLGIDQDEEALKVSADRLKDFIGSFSLEHDNFQNLSGILDSQSICKVDGLLFDLGMSSIQLEEPVRGFSFRLDGPLDMRMDKRCDVKAYDLVNKLPQDKLKSLMQRYGEERYASLLAKNIVVQRKMGPIATTIQLADVVRRSIPCRSGRIDPATRVFQALRIAINGELEALERVLQIAPHHLNKGGRICVISYHSLEDRIVKIHFRQFKKEGSLNIITEKPLRPKRLEVLENPRARSAKMRVAEKI